MSNAPASVRAYAATTRGYARVQHLLHGLMIGCFLGWMDRDALAALDAAYYDAHRETFAGGALPYTDPEHIRSGLADWEAAALDRHFPAGGRLVVTAAGAGREVMAALALGYDAVGYEPHAGMRVAGAAVLEADGHPGRLEAAGRDLFPAGAPPADGIVVGWGSFSHIPGRERRHRFLADARARLAPGAPLLLSFWALEGRERYLATVHAAAALVRRLRRAERAERGDLLAPLFVHVFDDAEIARDLAAAGFEVVERHAEPYPHVVARAV